jgi:excisionase family DNA binding protein
VNGLDDIRGLLVHLTLAVQAIQAQLAANHKSHYTVDEIANLVGRSDYTVRRWISTGRIKAMRIGGTGPKGRLLVPRDQLDALIATGAGAAIPDAVVGSSLVCEEL